MDTAHEMLRRIALNQEGAIEGALDLHGGSLDAEGLDPKTRALVRLGALLALDSATASYQWCVDDAVDAGATVGEVVGTLVAVAPAVGLARLVSATPKLALAIGYDVDEALESWDCPEPARDAWTGPESGA